MKPIKVTRRLNMNHHLAWISLLMKQRAANDPQLIQAVKDHVQALESGRKPASLFEARYLLLTAEEHGSVTAGHLCDFYAWVYGLAEVAEPPVLATPAILALGAQELNDGLRALEDLNQYRDSDRPFQAEQKRLSRISAWLVTLLCSKVAEEEKRSDEGSEGIFAPLFR